MSRTCDVLVIGAGVLGAAAAREIARTGLSVTVLEAERVNAHGSGATAGNIHIQAIHTRRPGQRTPVDVGRLLPLQRAASDGWRAWAGQLGPALGYRQSGGLTVAQTEGEVAELRRKQCWEQAAGIPTEIVLVDRLQGEQPYLGRSVVAATWCAEDGWADPAAAVPALFDDARIAGARLVEDARVVGLEPRTSGWQVTAGGETYSAAWVIDVAGPWLADVAALAGCSLRLSPTAIQMFLTQPFAPVLPVLVQHVAQGMSIKQLADGRLMVGGGWPARALRSDGTAEVDPAGLKGSLAQATPVLPLLGGARVERAWAGPLAATPDEMPVIGPAPGCPGLLVAGGTYSFTFAPVWAAVLLALITGASAPIDVQDLSPQRLSGRPTAMSAQP